MQECRGDASARLRRAVSLRRHQPGPSGGSRHRPFRV